MYSLGTTYKWSSIFETMETNKTELGLLDYSVSQTSLEQVRIKAVFVWMSSLKFKCHQDRINPPNSSGVPELRQRAAPREAEEEEAPLLRVLRLLYVL